MKHLLLTTIPAVLLAGCGDASPSAPTPEDLADIDLRPDHTVTVDEDGFDPAAIEVRSGELAAMYWTARVEQDVVYRSVGG